MQYQLYTLMVFDKNQNGVPIAWVISSRNTTNDIKKCLSTLFEIRIKERPDWQAHAFITDDVATEIEALRCFA